jgi:DNA-3-methyladenine glycosylase
MFESAGTWYVYMIYGMYHCLNIVTEAKDYPSAVLIRALEPVGLLTDQANGPGKLCRALEIDKKLNCSSAVSKNSKLYIEGRGIKIPKTRIIKTKRIGVDYAREWKDKKLRFYIKGNKFVSKM